MRPARVLIIAGSDSGGGAGIQADIKTVTCLQGYAASAITALTAQDTRGVHAIMPVDCRFIEQQIAVVLTDIGADCIKIGMLHAAAAIETVARVLSKLAPRVPVVVDPVMVAQSGDRLLAAPAVAALRDTLLPQAALVTPNLPEAEVLLGQRIEGREAMVEAARALRCPAVLLKGGHQPGGAEVVDVLATAAGVEYLIYPRIATRATHGTGCTLASAIATGLAQGLDLAAAVRRARAYLQRALESAFPLGHGDGPVNHLHTVARFKGS
ncbi:MAG: bifunctional hydroxymethylpyrimidine kinase/phosphomethylpyrimidine kinase [Nitrococcus mobilis]|nr:bifunctional hydroxymethylpyrimidine kinase/phosphomethylpyrimidine kinase [Nitrococcus mobilis]